MGIPGPRQSEPQQVPAPSENQDSALTQGCSPAQRADADKEVARRREEDRNGGRESRIEEYTLPDGKKEERLIPYSGYYTSHGYPSCASPGNDPNPASTNPAKRDIFENIDPPVSPETGFESNEPPSRNDMMSNITHAPGSNAELFNLRPTDVAGLPPTRPTRTV